MKVLMLSKATVVGTYQSKLEELAALDGLDLSVIMPPYWNEAGAARLDLERRHTRGYELIVEPIVFNGHHHVHFYPGLGRQIARIRPDVFHVDEEPFNLATAHAIWLGRRLGCKPLFYTWANIFRRYPFPFSLFERYSYAKARAAIAGNADAVAILRKKGFSKPISIIPQFGVDPEVFRPAGDQRQGERDMAIGYVGRLVPQKGLDVLLIAAAGLGDGYHLTLVGDGVAKGQLQRQAQELGILHRTTFVAQVTSTHVPAVLNSLDVLVLPSLTTKTWREQFGRVLVEAMACGLAVVGSDSGEIPHVIGDAGLVFPEGDAETLRKVLQGLADDGELRRILGERGRRRVLERYTQRAVALQHHEVYKQVQNEGTQPGDRRIGKCR